MGTSTEQAKSAIVDNLHQVFEEPDKAKRDEQIKRIWCDSVDAIFIDPDRVWRGHEDISKCVDNLQVKFGGWVFQELEPVVVLPEGGDTDIRVSKLKWAYGPPDDKAQVFGEDIATVVNGKIERLFAIIYPLA